MLNSILSDGASQLYARLIDGERIPAGPGTASDPECEGTAAHELIARGLAALSDRGETVLIPIEPATAQTALISNIMGRLQSAQRQLTESYNEFHEIHRRFNFSGPSSESGLVDLITDANRVVVLSDKMISSATEEVLAFNTAEIEVIDNLRISVPQAQAPHVPPQIKTIYTPDCIAVYHDLIHDSIAAGEHARISPLVPTKMNIVGRSQAMVALDRTDLHATLHIRARPLIDALRLLFELVWNQATPYPAAPHDDELSPQEQRVISLLATGAKDEAIARQLDVTVRTVRRHITSAMTKLGADNRFAAGVQATKRGWI